MKHLFAFYFLLFTINIWSQTTAWDDDKAKKWAAECKQVNIKSSFDATEQPSIIYASTHSQKQPLIVSLHTWSGDYTQEDSLVSQVIAQNWNYIHPNFRGPNNQITACGSEAAVQDIDDAIQYALANMSVDPNEVHIIGVSGGGYMTMMCYMKLKYPAKSFSSWVGLSDLEAWYFESIGRNQKYAKGVLKCTNTEGVFDSIEIRKRSPLYQKAPNRKAFLHLYAGIHDGYQGSVPITQTINFYNKIITEQYPNEINKVVDNQTILDLVVRQYAQPQYPFLMDKRAIYLWRKTPSVSLTIFEGRHEMLTNIGLSLIPTHQKTPFDAPKIVAIGDSNGAIEEGWVNQLKRQLPLSSILNFCKAGRTIGFDNNNDTSLNELRLIDAQLDSATKVYGRNMDCFIVALGTNDTKSVFSDKQKVVTENFEKLINKILAYKQKHALSFKIIVILPPPIGKIANEGDKYKNAQSRLTTLRSHFEKYALKNNCSVINAHSLFQNSIEEYAKDGVHLNFEAQTILARNIAQKLNKL